MIILSIDTAGETASVAVSDQSGQIYEKKNTDPLDHLKSLIRLIASVLSESSVKKEELEAIAVSAGPGSFTGIRIGMAAARTLAQVLDIKVAPVMTLDSYLYHDYPVKEPFFLCPMTDARRGNVFAAVYEVPERRKIVPEGVYRLEEWINTLPPGRTIVFTGSGASRYQDFIRDWSRKKTSAEGNRKEAENIPAEDRSAEGQTVLGFIEDYRHHASSVLQCALAQKNFVDFNDAEPVYLRKAEAEIKRAEGRLGLKARKRIEKERQKILEMPPAEEPISYRSLSEEDAGELAELDALCFKKPWKEKAFQGDLQGTRKAVYEGAFNSDGKLIGFAGAVSVTDEAEVNRVAVHPLYRTRGIGGDCLDRVLKKLEENGTETAFLEVREANRSAITLYKSKGFRVISKRKNYYQETGENALIMQWKKEEPFQ